MRRLHLDTDLGGDIDDLCALAIVLNWPQVDLIGVTTVSDNLGKRAGYTRYALELAGRQGVPVAAGADASLGRYRTYPDLPDEAAYWPEPIAPAPNSLDQALSLLEQSIEEDALIVAIGPFTNLAFLERRSPGILSRARLFLMGGYLFPPRDGFPAWGNNMDWNVQSDVESADFVFQHSHPTLIPLSVTIETSLRRAYLPSLRRSGGLAGLIARQAEAFAKDNDFEAKFGRTCKALPEDTINFLHDPLACAIALGWNDGIQVEEVAVMTEMREGWLQQRVGSQGRPMRLVTRVEGARFSEFWLSLVAGNAVRGELQRA